MVETSVGRKMVEAAPRRSGVLEVMQIVTGELLSPGFSNAGVQTRADNQRRQLPANCPSAQCWGAVERQALIASKPNVPCETVGELRTLILENTKSTGVLRG